MFPEFDAQLPLEAASTPASSCYVDACWFAREAETVFRRSWQPVARAEQLQNPGQFVAGTFLDWPYVVLRDEHGTLQSFYNVCRHHAAEIATGAGTCSELVCPYHGWKYTLQGELCSAPQLGAVQNFQRQNMQLPRLAVQAAGPWVWLNFSPSPPSILADFSPIHQILQPTGYEDLAFYRRVEYEIACNWKVYVDNYLDGGYHVAAVHRGLADQLNLDAYQTDLLPSGALQSCHAASSASPSSNDFAARIGDSAWYAWLYPNFMINRYGPWMDTNWVIPLSADRTLTVFDYYLDSNFRLPNSDYCELSLQASDQVQQEDISICESVQRGLKSGAFHTGRYALREIAEHHFNLLLFSDLNQAAK